MEEIGILEDIEYDEEVQETDQELCRKEEVKRNEIMNDYEIRSSSAYLLFILSY